MNHLFFKLIFLTTVGFVLAISANAQLCGQYATTLLIKDFGGKPIENAVVQLLPIKKDETKGKTFVRDDKDLSKFTITFYEGHLIYEKYKVIISADGFETSEKEISFPHCERQKFDIQLNAGNKSEYSVLTGTVYDPIGAVIVNVKITAVNQKGKIFETFTNEDGVYSLSLPVKNNKQKNSLAGFMEEKYDISAEFRGFRITRIKNFVFIPSQFGKMHLDLALEAGANID